VRRRGDRIARPMSPIGTNRRTTMLNDVRFSNRPVWVKHFQAIHHFGESTSLAGSRFSPESAPGPFHHGIRGRGGTIFGSALPSE